MTEAIYQKRRQRVFFVLSGLFLGTLAMLNILGISRFLDLSFSVFGVQIPMMVAIGVQKRTWKVKIVQIQITTMIEYYQKLQVM